jgi:hypothetical protein
MSNLNLKEKIYGYYYVNASKVDKEIFLLVRFSDTEAYVQSFIFPKCKISYVSWYHDSNDNDEFKFIAQAGSDLATQIDAVITYMLANGGVGPEPRRPASIVLVGDTEKKSINFITEDEQDKTYSDVLFAGIPCKSTPAEDVLEEIVRQAVLDGNAGTNYDAWSVDGPCVIGNVINDVGPCNSDGRRLITFHVREPSLLADDGLPLALGTYKALINCNSNIVTITIYNVAGELVRTLNETEVKNCINVDPLPTSTSHHAN